MDLCAHLERKRQYSVHHEELVCVMVGPRKSIVYTVGSRAGWQAGASKDQCAVGSGGDLDVDSSSQRLERRSALSKSKSFYLLIEI